MDIRKCENTIETYFINVTKDIFVTVKVVNNKEIYIEKIKICLDKGSFEYCAKDKHQVCVYDINNLELAIEEFISIKLYKMKEKLDEVNVEKELVIG